MPRIKLGDLNLNYDQQGSGEPVVLIPYLTADFACYAFQVAEYAKHFTCISLDPRGAGASDTPAGAWSIEMLADDVAAFMQVLQIDRAHIAGLSSGAATAMWLAAKYPDKVKSLSLHSAWHKSDPFVRTVVETWQALAKYLGSVTEMAILGIFPWCYTPELYAEKPEYIDSLAEFVRGRPAQSLDAFERHSDAVIAHDVSSHLGNIKSPTQITFGRYDMITSTRFAEPLMGGIQGAELVVFEGCSHAPIYEKVDEFNQTTLAFLLKHAG